MNTLLFTGGTLSIIAGIAHIGIIFGGANWYRFFGAGEKMAQMAEKGLIYPTIITSIIATMLIVWGLYAFSAAGIIRQLPFLKTITVLIGTVYLLRGSLLLPALFLTDGLRGWNNMDNGFWIWSSLISLTIGGLYVAGLARAWSDL